MANNGFIGGGPTRSALVAQLLQRQQRQHQQQPNPSGIGEALARTGSTLVDAFVSKQAIDDELERREQQQMANLKAMQIASGGVQAWENPDFDPNAAGGSDNVNSIIPFQVILQLQLFSLEPELFSPRLYCSIAVKDWTKTLD